MLIFESIGTPELVLIGIVALIFLGPRKMPEMAKKIGKIMADFRNTTGEFKETWEREVNFDEEAKALNLNDLESAPVARIQPATEEKMEEKSEESIVAPTIKEIDPASFKKQQPAAENKPEVADSADDLNDKKNWL